eukprot:6135657-Prymnesium_polylepis.1
MELLTALDALTAAERHDPAKVCVWGAHLEPRRRPRRRRPYRHAAALAVTPPSLPSRRRPYRHAAALAVTPPPL